MIIQVTKEEDLDRILRCRECWHGTIKTYAIMAGRAHPMRIECKRNKCQFMPMAEGAKNDQSNHATRGNTGTHGTEHIIKAPLSAMDAFRLYNITDLAGRICRLKEKGWMISRKRCQKLDKRGKEITHWNEYRIIPKCKTSKETLKGKVPQKVPLKDQE